MKLIGHCRPAGSHAIDSSVHTDVANNSDQPPIKIDSSLTLSLTRYRSGLILLVLANSMSNMFIRVELCFSDWKISAFNNTL